jgi:hypothetical protein
MNFKSYIFLSLIAILVVACSSSEDDPVPQPAAANLLFPLQDSECSEGVIVNDQKSQIAFEWNESDNTDSYELHVERLNSTTVLLEETNGTEMDVQLERGKAYKWFVVSRSDRTKKTATSNVWSFYNAGTGNISHVPFPAELLNPVNGHSFAAATTTVKLEWNGSDLDNDIVQYEVYMDSGNPPSTLTGTISDKHLQVDVVTGTTYYWYIRSIDETGNASNSEIFRFSIE